MLAGVRDARTRAAASAVCAVWPKGSAPADATSRSSRDKPTLILSGGLDPVTPPANGALVAKTLPNSRHIVAGGYGHIVSPHACAPRLIASFIDDPDFATLSQECAAHLATEPAPSAVAKPAGAGAMIAIDGWSSTSAASAR